MKKGFTLVELLVVVLIIGILAAVAVPMYQKAVERSRAMQAILMLKSVYQAAQEYHLAQNTWPTSFSELSIIPHWTGNTPWYTGTNEVQDVLSNDNWSLQLINQSDESPFYNGLNIGRLSGQYKGIGFVIWHEYPFSADMPLNTILCTEKTADIKVPGEYCQKIMQGGTLFYTGTVLRYYKMP